MRHNGLTQKQMVELFPTVDAQKSRLDLMLHDVLNGLVTWGSWIVEPHFSGRYRVGVTRMTVYPLAILQFRAKGQNDQVNVHDLEQWESELRQRRTSLESLQPVLDAIASAR